MQARRGRRPSAFRRAIYLGGAAVLNPPDLIVDRSHRLGCRVQADIDREAASLTRLQLRHPSGFAFEPARVGKAGTRLEARDIPFFERSEVLPERDVWEVGHRKAHRHRAIAGSIAEHQQAAALSIGVWMQVVDLLDEAP